MTDPAAPRVPGAAPAAPRVPGAAPAAPRAAAGRGHRDRYGSDVLAVPPPWRQPVPQVDAEPGLVVETSDEGVVGAVVACTADTVTLEDRHGRRRVVPLLPAGFLLEGRTVTLVRPRGGAPLARRRTRAGGLAAAAPVPARTARASRLWVEGVHDAELLEHVWGEELREQGVVVEPLHGVRDLAAAVRSFGPAPRRRLGVLVDHLVPGSAESREAATVRSPHVLVTGHPFVDVWEAVRPAVAGLRSWPVVPRGTPWKDGVCAALAEPDAGAFWRATVARVRGPGDLETPLLSAVERLVDFVCGAPQDA